MYDFNHAYGIGIGAPQWIPVFGATLLLLVLWSLFWKAIALWHSARRGQHWWFIAILLLNTAGILEMVYLFGIAKIKFNNLFSR